MCEPPEIPDDEIIPPDCKRLTKVQSAKMLNRLNAVCSYCYERAAATGLSLPGPDGEVGVCRSCFDSYWEPRITRLVKDVFRKGDSDEAIRTNG